MKSSPIIGLRLALLAGCAGIALAPAVAAAQSSQAFVAFDIPAQDLDSALTRFGQQSEREIIISSALTRNRRAPAVQGNLTPEDALGLLLADSGLTYRVSSAGSLVVEAADPQGGSAAGGGAEVEALIVTAQKREEDIQDVPIAMSAFSQEDLTTHQIAGGPDLMTQVPNVTFTKTNFSSYSVQIRGIGTQAISATTDPAVAVAFNNTPFIRNRFFEQEFYDLQRIEVLRGPQGTLYGRNATAGVINILSARPKHVFEAKLSADVANFSSTRLEGMVNIPLVEDVVALRLAAAWTKRDGYATNQMTGEQIDGRDLWSARATLGFEPTERISAYLTYEHFEEDDDRIRSGKQLCKKTPTPTHIGDVAVPESAYGGHEGILSYITQGCQAASLYSDESFQTPNAFALPYWGALAALGLPVDFRDDPYVSTTQSRDLRVIESSFEPHYQAKTDLLHLQLNVDLANDVTFTSETAYSGDSVFSTQDYNRFTTRPQAFTPTLFAPIPGIFDENLVFCDPQLGCSDRLLVGDLATSESTQYSQEFRVSSDWDGAVNFSAGLNFLRHDAEDKYYVFVNTLSLFSAQQWGARTIPYVAGESDNLDCLASRRPGDPDAIHSIVNCIYIDPNPIGSLNDQGHNYFLSKNPYRLISYAAFGELYYKITPNLKFTVGARFTVDKKHAPEIPSWLLAAHNYGYPVASVLDQEWREPTGRVAIDWKPVLSFTDETLLYASYAHGYKAGGANPPRPVLVGYADVGVSEEVRQNFLTHPKTFEPEFVDAFELGAKNTLMEGRLTANANVFYYDYQGYQISEIVDRAALNRNFDAEIWGAELEVAWRPLENLKLGFKGGYEHTRVADGEKVIDLMDRTAGDPAYMVVKPFPTVPSNCIAPVSWVAGTILTSGGEQAKNTCLYYLGLFGGPEANGLGDVPNNGEGIFKDLGGNELPNAPDFTTTVTVDYTLPLPHEWLMTLHADYYRQSEAWWRIINADPYDRLEPYQTVNFAAIFTNEDAGWNIMAYVKNVFDETAITGAFLNSDDTGLTTNVFLTEPRLYGLRATKKWTGGTAWGGSGRHTPGEPYPFNVEVGGGLARIDAPNETFNPTFVETSDSPTLQSGLRAQDEELDWGDSREVKITYARPGSWRLAAAYRHGETNGHANILAEEHLAGGRSFSDPVIAMFPFLAGGDKYIEGPVNYVLSDIREREEHTFADLAVGRDVGLGGLGASHLAIGLRYASFKSSTRAEISGTADHIDLPEENVAKYHFMNIHQYDIILTADRAFEGAGPTLSWDASKALLGDNDTGHLNVDIGAQASVLFGKQRTDARFTTEDRLRRYDNLHQYLPPVLTLSTSVGPAGGHDESDSVTVYGLGANIGLSYEIDRIKVSGGYRIERFYDVLDGGVDEPSKVDRTIDGPYFKIAVGFGG